MDSVVVWQEAALQQAELVAQRMRELLGFVLVWLRSELGLEVGLEPARLPTWALLLLPALLVVVLLWAAACGGRRKSRAVPVDTPSGAGKTTVGARSSKTEEGKKKSKRKVPEKIKSAEQSVPELSEEEVIESYQKETLKLARDAEKKIEKSKKKKKSKSDTKQGQLSSLDGKEFEEGTWETKISNKEKRQHRKRVKGTGESELSGVEAVLATEQLANLVAFPVGIRKNKVSTDLSGIPTVNGGGWNEKPIKISQLGGGEEKWLSMPSSAAGKKTETSTWSQDSGDANGKDWSAPWSERPLFQSIPSASEAISQPGAPDVQWDLSCNPPRIDDEWSGSNGLNCAETSSDWKAPAEEWGNYNEVEIPNLPLTEEPLADVPKISDDEKEKVDPNVQCVSSAKTKKKKKKKKKQGEDGGSPAQDTDDLEREVGDDFQEEPSSNEPPLEVDLPLNIILTSEPDEPEEESSQIVFIEPSVTVSQNITEKITIQVPQPLQEDVSSSNKQNSVPPPLQTKSEESWESPKQVKKKKKARRET
ncbi:protein LYRIC isoform X2 [Ambystoma mexicanum]|uniref:protein LYRIC isoform X2 n=1 Tax=Ambystoma mexicanum TaxID=8296 RepID=UPI0037E79F4A